MIYNICFLALTGFITMRLARLFYILEGNAQAEGLDAKAANVIPLSKLSKFFFKSADDVKHADWDTGAKKTTRRLVDIADSLGRFLGIFCLVAFAFSIMEYWLKHTTDIVYASATILKIEQTQHYLNAVVKHFKIPTGYDIAATILLIFLASAFPFVEHYKVKDKVKKYKKVISTILYVLTICTSFTFFGHHFDKKEDGIIGKLERHKLEIIEDNKLLVEKIHKEIVDKVVNEILIAPPVEQVLAQISRVEQRIDKIKSGQEYKNYAVVPVVYLSRLSINVFEQELKKKYNFDNAEQVFLNSSRSSPRNSKYDFYKVASDARYKEFTDQARPWFRERELSENRVKQAIEVFEKGKNAHAKNLSKLKSLSEYYTKYKEPLEKMIEKVWDNSGQSWLNEYLEKVGIDFPFLGDLIDPLINDPVKDFLKHETGLILKSALENDENGVAQKLDDCSLEIKKRIYNTYANNKKIEAHRNIIITEIAPFKAASTNTLLEIARQTNKANLHLKQLSESCRWEKIRSEFLLPIKAGNDLKEMSPLGRSVCKLMLDDWGNYKERQKLIWFLDSEQNLEPLFYKYMYDKLWVKIVWGGILKQQGWGIAEDDYKKTHPGITSKKNPLNFLKYYCHATDKENEFWQVFPSEYFDPEEIIMHRALEMQRKEESLRKERADEIRREHESLRSRIL